MKRQSTDLFKRRWVCDVDGITEAGVAHGVCAPNRVDGQREKAKDKPLTMHLAYRKVRGRIVIILLDMRRERSLSAWSLAEASAS